MKPLFEATNPGIKVDIITVDGGEYQSKVIASSVANAGPDIIELWPGPESSQLLDKGLLLDLMPLVKRDSFDLRNYIPTAIDAFTWHGQLWGFPYSGYPTISIYKPETLAQAGLADPHQLGKAWTWAEAARYAERLTVQKPGDANPQRYGVEVTWQQFHRTGMWVHQAGGSFFDNVVDPKQARFTSEPVLQALNWLNGMIRKGLVQPNWGMAENLLTNSTAIFLDGGPFLFGMAGYQAAPGQLSTEIAISPPPAGPKHNGTIFISDGWMISKGTANADAAWSWLKFLVSDPDRMQRFVQLTARVPSLIKALPYYQKALPKGLLHGEVVPNLSVDVNTTHTDIMSPAASDLSRVFGERMTAVYNGTESPESAMAKLQEQAQAFLNHVKR